MKTKKLSLSILLMLLTLVGFSQQDYSFKVLANKGNNEVKSGSTWAPLKTGASLKETDELKVSENAYIGLVYVNGKPMEIKQTGKSEIYKVSMLVEKAKAGSGTTVLQKYTDFILSSNSPEAKKNRLSATGAVERGMYPIHLILPENQYSGIFNTSAHISWETSNVSGPYVVFIKNMFDDELAKIETSEKVYTLDLNDSKFSKENALLIEVKSKADAKQVSKQHLIKKLAPAEQDAIKKSYDLIANDVSEPTALNKVILAGFYEDHKLLIDAITAYEDAIRTEPDVAAYKEAYEDFLFRHGIKKK